MSKFYLCKICGNLIEKIDDSGRTPSCCGTTMYKLIENISDVTSEKHLPQITKYHLDPDDSFIQLHIEVGSILHPMQSNHYIKWIQVNTDKSSYRFYFEPTDRPIVDCIISSKEIITEVYAYCNIHGLWVEKKA